MCKSPISSTLGARSATRQKTHPQIWNDPAALVPKRIKWFSLCRRPVIIFFADFGEGPISVLPVIRQAYSNGLTAVGVKTPHGEQGVRSSPQLQPQHAEAHQHTATHTALQQLALLGPPDPRTNNRNEGPTMVSWLTPQSSSSLTSSAPCHSATGGWHVLRTSHEPGRHGGKRHSRQGRRLTTISTRVGAEP